MGLIGLAFFTTPVLALGAGKVLATMARRIDPALAALAVGAPAEIEAFVKTL